MASMRDRSAEGQGVSTLLRWANAHEALRAQRLIGLGLLASGISPLLALIALPSGREMIEVLDTGLATIAALVLAPALVWVAVALQGFAAILGRLRTGSDTEYPQAVIRVYLGALIFLYCFGLLALLPSELAITLCLLIASLALAAAWLLLLYAVFDPLPSRLLRCGALVSDVILLSLLLTAGGSRTAALAPVLLYIVISGTDWRVPREAIGGAVWGAAAFAVVAVVTPFWRGVPLMAAGVLGAVVALPVYVGALLRRLSAAKVSAEAANFAQHRLLAAIGEDLRGPLRTIARAIADIDLAALDRHQRDTIAQIRLNERALWLELGNIRSCADFDGWAPTPETRSFDIYQLAKGTVEALRTTAAARGVLLALRIAPQLPYQLSGQPHRLRQILMSLMTSALCLVRNATVLINLEPVRLNDGCVTLRLAITGGRSTGQLETADQAARPAAIGRSPGHAAVARLVEMMGGSLAVEISERRGLSLVAELPFAIDGAFPDLLPHLSRLPVLIVGDDAGLADDLIEVLQAWRAEPHWIGADNAALNYIEAFDPAGRRTVLIVDGRGNVLRALGWAQFAEVLRAREPAQVLFIADEAHIDSLIGLADGELDGILPAPFTMDMLRRALHSLSIERTTEWVAGHASANGGGKGLSPQQGDLDSPPEDDVVSLPAPLEELRIDAASASSGKLTWQILIVTSNPSNRKIMGSILRRVGHTVHLAATVDEALRCLQARSIELLLFDLSGPLEADYDAAQLCRRIQPDVTIVALTRDDAKLTERSAREVGLDATLVKPVGPRRLIASIDAAMEARAARFGSSPAAPISALEPVPAAGPRSVDRETASAEPVQSGESFQRVIDTFRSDSRRIVAGIGQAAFAGDTQAFEDGLRALRNCTAGFDVGRLQDLLHSMHGHSPAALRQQAVGYAQHLSAELARLDAALVDRLRSVN
jgi:two-component system, sensor histidine kinase RpfC